MNGNLARRIDGLEQRSGQGKDVIAFWSGPQDNEKLAAAERLSRETGRPLLVIRWQECPDTASA